LLWLVSALFYNTSHYNVRLFDGMIVSDWRRCNSRNDDKLIMFLLLVL